MTLWQVGPATRIFSRLVTDQLVVAVQGQAALMVCTPGFAASSRPWVGATGAGTGLSVE